VTSFLRNLFLEDLWLKLFSLVLAILVWLTVTVASRRGGGTEGRILSNVPLTVLASTDGIHNLEVSPREVEVTVRGDPITVDALQRSDIKAVVDITGVTAARDLRQRIVVSVPAGITSLRVTPEEAQVIFSPGRR
jgi:YbbR domain-containing protein